MIAPGHSRTLNFQSNAGDFEIMAILKVIPRRQFLKLVGATTVASAAGRTYAAAARKISIVVHEADPVASTKPVAWAVKQLYQALSEKGISPADGVTRE